jgi:hypothetical protein
MPDNKPGHDGNFDNVLAKTAQDIATYGLHVISVPGTHYLPSFTYSVGLLETYGHPEIICFGLKTDLMHALVNDVAAFIKEGSPMQPGNTYDIIFKGLDATFLRVDPANIDDYFGVAIRYYKRNDFPALQLVWPDNENRFPWEDGFAKGLIDKQPLLDRNASFKFRETKNLAVFTTRQWLDLQQPIVEVVHDHNGDWQFLTGDQELEDLKIVAIGQIIQKDPTLNEVFNLDYGEAAKRAAIGAKWFRSKIEEEVKEAEEGDE